MSGAAPRPWYVWLISALAPIAAGGLAIIVTGAVYNHLRTDPPGKALPALTLLILCLVLLWLRRGEVRG